MSKFESVLSDDDLAQIIHDVAWPNDEIMSFAMLVAIGVQQAVLAKLAEEADMFWDLDNPEWSRESISCILLEDNDFDSSDVGKVIELMRAKSLPNVSVLITSYDEEEGQITWRVIEND